MNRQSLHLRTLLRILAPGLTPAGPVAFTSDSSPPNATEAEHAKGLAAWEQGDWQTVIEQMAKVIARSPSAR